jgi:hypothetical protein
MNEHKMRDRQGKQRFGGGDGGGGGKGGLGHKQATAETVVAPAAVVVDIRDLTKIACNRVVQMVGDVERCHSMNDFMVIPMQERAVEKYIDPFRENWEYRYYDALFDIDIYANGGGGKGANKSSGIDRVQSICVNYIEDYFLRR